MMKKFGTLMMGLGLAAMLAVPSMAAEMRGRLKAVDADKSTITVTEKKVDHDLTVTADTKYIGADGNALADGLKSAALAAGTRVAVTYDTKDGKDVVSQIQVRKPRAAQ